ncbi:family 78 glycoside hydrolase catalytic domain [Yinghuangia sp. YIM S10712]|uniref:family 78 glycoside hydrolase catalytic domain n=1 Tax=Yinghuangia sp. YIM S10712 TaxID=3436930 RepID=UPI003F52A1F8
MSETTPPPAAGLRVEHLTDSVLGLGVAKPRLSWRLPPGALSQTAYAIAIDGRDMPPVESSECVLVPWPGNPVGSRTRVQWQVKVWTELGESPWSEPAWFETGLLEPGHWTARWIEPEETERGSHVLRRTFTLDEHPDNARLYATAHGIYEMCLNGRRVGDIELAPGFTSYPTTLHVQVYDVSELLSQGENEWDVVLSDGWHRGRFGFMQLPDGYGTTLGFLGQLHAADTVVATGPEWRSASGPVVTADLMAGQFEDHRRQPTTWHPVSLAEGNLGPLGYSPAPPTRSVQALRPVAVTRPAPDRQVVDLGRNINGWIRLTSLGPAGTDLRLVHGEALDATGDVTQDHLAADTPLGRLPVGMTDRVIAAGTPGEVFEPRHTTHGFRYVRIEGHPDRLTPDDVTGVVVHTDLRRTGWFRCSDERLNKLHEIAEWSFRGNACEIPTDCPHRERAGWTGDWQVFAPAAAFLYDVAGFSLKWLRDLAAEQLEDGCVTGIVPDPLRRRTGGTGRWRDTQGSAGWGDAVVIVPWTLWRSYADIGVLREMWPSITAWIDYAAETARTRRHPDRAAARPVPAPHEHYLWDAGYHWGEWLEPGTAGEDFRTADHGAVATAYLHHSAQLAARIAEVLGHEADAARFAALAANARAAWQAEFIGEDDKLTPETQATYVRALAFRLVPDESRDATAARLVELVRKADTHLGTGFLATPYLLPVLADAGRLDVAYELLLQDTAPSWLTMVERGATTIWESWDGIDADGVPHASLNHYSKGAVISFLHEYVAGIRALDDHPGYRRFRVAPHPGADLTWAEGVHDSPYGRIESAWRIKGDDFDLTVTVPPGTTAEVVLPDGTTSDQGPGTMSYRCRSGR